MPALIKTLRRETRMQPASGITAKGATAISNGLNAFPGVLAYMAAFTQHTRNAAPRP